MMENTQVTCKLEMGNRLEKESRWPVECRQEICTLEMGSK